MTDRSGREERSDSRKDSAEGQERFRMCEAADETMVVAGESASDFPPQPRASYSEGLLKANCWGPPSES